MANCRETLLTGSVASLHWFDRAIDTGDNLSGDVSHWETWARIEIAVVVQFEPRSVRSPRVRSFRGTIANPITFPTFCRSTARLRDRDCQCERPQTKPRQSNVPGVVVISPFHQVVGNSFGTPKLFSRSALGRIDCFYERQNRVLIKASGKISVGCRIRNALRSQTGQDSFVIATQLDVFEPQTVQQGMEASFNAYSFS